MSRVFKKISMVEFQKKLLPILTEEFPHELPESLEDDLSKVQFDFENCEPSVQDENDPIGSLWGNGFANYPCGFMTLPNDMPVLFVNAGGDWEFPICFVIYFDGKKIRAYIPQKGNIWNRKFKTAFGSEDIGYNDESAAKKFNKSLADFITESAQWCTTDELAEIHKKMSEDYNAAKDAYPDPCNLAEMCRGFIDNFNLSSPDAIINDVMTRIVEKK